MVAMTTMPLDGVRVLECCRGIAGAFCARLLADLGAEVVKIEPPDGDPARHSGPFPPGRATPETSGRFLYLGAGKQSVVLDGSTGSRARIAGLASEADVVIEDGWPGIEKAIGAARPEQVWCSLTPFGLTGPYSGFQAVHLTLFHAGGEGHLLPSGEGWSRFPERPPIQLGSDAGEYDAGFNAGLAVLAAVRVLRRTGRGQRIDVSAQESQLTLNRTRLSRFTNDGIAMHRGPSPYPIGGMLSCADGWVQLVGPREEHWARLAEIPEGRAFGEPPLAGPEERAANVAALRALLADWCAVRPKDDVVRILSGVGCAIGAFATARDVRASAQLEHRGFFQRIEHPDAGAIDLPGVPYRFSATPVRLRAAPRLGSGRGFRDRRSAPHRRTFAPGDAPLAGIRVVDFTWAAAGPYATLLLALLGAEVIKVESSRRPDPARRGFLADYGGADRSPNFNELNLDKRSFQVDLTQPRGLELVRRLIAISDVVVDNFRPGVMQRFGLDAERLLREHPRLVVAASSANGSTGPEAAGAGLASVFGATGGLSEQTGHPDGPPTEIGESTDYRSANALAFAILAALEHRDRTGVGQSVDLASREVVVAIAPDAVLAEALGCPWSPRIGNRHRALAPHGVYPAAGPDEWLALAVTSDAQWQALCDLLGARELCARHATAEQRKKAEDEIDAAIEGWTRGRSARDAFLELQARGVPAAPSFTNAELAADPHLAARGAFVDVVHPVIGSARVMRAPWLFSESRCEIHRHGPLLGQDNGFVLGLLGLAAGESEALAEVFR
jgi:crotonobetainyl-CoA:carnitine CoA-transferase CaiB-like acyl-CoA transferase